MRRISWKKYMIEGKNKFQKNNKIVELYWKTVHFRRLECKEKKKRRNKILLSHKCKTEKEINQLDHCKWKKKFA
jgi:hypothetical protein